MLTLGSPANAAPKLEIIHSGERKWELLKADLEQASSSICLEYYHFADDASGREIRDVLLRKAGEGIPIRLIVENVAHGFMPKQFFTEMEKAGVEVRYFTDLDSWDALSDINERDHRKIAVIDSRIGYLGGMNLADDYHYRWRDTHLRLEGPSVTQLERVFYRMWTARGGKGAPEESPASLPDDGIEIVTGGPAYPVFVKKYLEALQSARTYAYIETPYFCPPDTLVSALKTTASRGVDVRIIVPKKTDHGFMDLANQSFFPELLEAGIRIYEWQDHVLHAKQFITDDYLLGIGSANMDNLSFFLNYEVEALVYNEPATRNAASTFLSDTEKHCREITLQEVKNWSVFRKFRNWFTRHLGGPVG